MTTDRGIASLTRERDEARAEVEQLREELEQSRKLWVDKWCLVNNDRSAAVTANEGLTAEVERLRGVLEKAAPFVRLVLHSTEARYDDPNSEYYDDGAQYEIMRECEEILAAIGAAMREGE